MKKKNSANERQKQQKKKKKIKQKVSASAPRKAFSLLNGHKQSLFIVRSSSSRNKPCI